MARAHPGRGEGGELDAPGPGRVPLHGLLAGTGLGEEGKEPLRLGEEAVPVDLPEPEDEGVVEERPHLGVGDRRLPRPVVRGQERDDGRGGEGVDGLDTEGLEEPPRPRRAESRGELPQLRDEPGESPGDRLAQELGNREEGVEVGVAIDEARHHHAPSGVEPRGARTGEAGEIGADGGHAPARHRHVPLNDLARVDIDDIGARHQEVGRGLPQGNPEEVARRILAVGGLGRRGLRATRATRAPATGSGTPGRGRTLPWAHAATPGGVIRRVHRPRALHVRSNSA